MRIIPLTNGEDVMVDDEDFIFLDRFSWYCSSRTVVTQLPRQNGKQIFLEMWKLLVDTKNKKGEHFIKEISYKDKNCRNLQKGNLLLVDLPTTLHLNKKRTTGNNGVKPTSLYKGVSRKRRMTRHKKGSNHSYYAEKSWRAEIKYRGKLELKYFDNEKDAALWYNERAKELYGEHAYQNIIN